MTDHEYTGDDEKGHACSGCASPIEDDGCVGIGCIAILFWLVAVHVEVYL